MRLVFGAWLSPFLRDNPALMAARMHPGTALIPWFFQGLEVLVLVSWGPVRMMDHNLDLSLSNPRL